MQLIKRYGEPLQTDIMSPEIARLGHIALVTPDLESSLWFYKDMIGLFEVERTDDTVFLRAAADREHHTLSLTEGEEALVDHVGLRTQEPEHVEEFAEILEEDGREVQWVEAGEETGQGEAIRFETPGEHIFEIYYDVEKPVPEGDERSGLKPRLHKFKGGTYPQRLDHINLWCDNVEEMLDWLMDVLNFELTEYVLNEDDEIYGAWTSSNAVNHDIAIQQDNEGKQGQHHHVAYYLPNSNDILDAADLLRDHEVPMDFDGPGKHGVSMAEYLYTRDPASDHRVELYTGGYIVLDPDWEPIEWGPEEGDTVLSWFGPAANVVEEYGGASMNRTVSYRSLDQ